MRMAHLRAPAGECIIELFEYVQPASIDVALEPARVGNAYVCFLLLDLDSVYDRLRARGVESLSAPVTIDTGVNTGGRAIYLRESGAGISGVSSLAEVLPRGAYRRREVADGSSGGQGRRSGYRVGDRCGVRAHAGSER